MPPPKLLPSMMSAPKNPGAFRPDPNAKDRPDLLSVPVDFIKGLIGFDANSTGRLQQNGKLAPLSSPNAAGQVFSSGLPIAGGSKLLYSRLERAAQSLPEFAHPNRILSLLKSNASGEEMSLRGIMDFLRSQGDRKVAKSAVLEHLAGNPLPSVEKNVLTPIGKRTSSGAQVNKTQYNHPSLSTPMGVESKNYRENLYHINQPGEVYGAPHFDNTDIDSFVGPLEGNRNLLMHSRTTERELPDRGRILMGEEDQSDWHQMGRERGYKTAETEELRKAKNAQLDILAAQIDDIDAQYLAETGEDIFYQNPRESTHPLVQQRAQLRNELMRIQNEFAAKYPGVLALSVPDAPYKQEWPNILWKDQLGEAVERPDIKGYGWAQGYEQNRRSGNLPDQFFEGIPGLEPTAEEFIQQQKPMQDFYDVRKKNAIDKFLRQHGGRVEEITVPGTPKKRPLNDYFVTPRGEIQELPPPDEWGDVSDEGEIVASVWPQFKDINEDLPRGFQVIDALERQQEAKGLTIPTEIKIWYAALPDHVKESIKRGGIPFLMALWAAHQAEQNNNMDIPTPPGGIQ